MTHPLRFTAAHISGAGRGKALGIPTINLASDAIPANLEEGVYAVIVSMHTQQRLPGMMHYGARPTFGDTPSCEVHIIDHTVNEEDTQMLTVEVRKKLRDVQKFESPEELVAQLQRDRERAKKMLGDY